MPEGTQDDDKAQTSQAEHDLEHCSTALAQSDGIIPGEVEKHTRRREGQPGADQSRGSSHQQDKSAQLRNLLGDRRSCSWCPVGDRNPDPSKLNQGTAGEAPPQASATKPSAARWRQ